MHFGEINAYILMGGGRLLAECALGLKKTGCRVFVVSSPRQISEDLHVPRCTLEEYLSRNGLEHHVSENINTDSQVIKGITPQTLGMSIAAAWLFRKPFIDLFEGRLLNAHGTRLPQDRGSGGFSWQILRDNHLGCCLVHQVDEGLDTGPIVKYKEFAYPSACRIPNDYREVYVRENQAFLLELFEEIKRGVEFELIGQAEYLSSYWPRLSTEHHGYIDWSWSMRQIERFICAFDEPYKGASTFVRGKKVHLKSCFVDVSDGGFHPFQKGLVYRQRAGAQFVATEDGTLVIKQVRDDNGNNVAREIQVGDRFYTPIDLLEKAKQYRAIYTPQGLKS